MKEVRAAGGVIWEEFDHELRVLVVHRPRYNDWSFPKGKHELGEDDLACAIREVTEETGFFVQVGEQLPEAHYTDHKGRPKTVAYWSMQRTPGSADFVANDEVDEALWLCPADVETKLTYEIDRQLLRQFIHLREIGASNKL